MRGTKPIKANDFIFGLEANDLGERFRRTKPIWANDLGERNRFRRTIFKANDRSPRQFFKANEISFALAITISKPDLQRASSSYTRLQCSAAMAICTYIYMYRLPWCNLSFYSASRKNSMLSTFRCRLSLYKCSKCKSAYISETTHHTKRRYYEHIGKSALTDKAPSNHICSHMFTNFQYFQIVSLGNVRYVVGNS